MKDVILHFGKYYPTIFKQVIFMKKYISLMAFCLLAVFSQVLVSCSDDGADEKSNANGYKVDLPSGTSGVKIEPLSDEEVTKLNPTLTL